MTALKAIHFAVEEDRVHEIPTLDDLTDEEYGSCYYSAAEYLWINKRERKLLKRLKMVGDVGEDDDTLGLVSKSQNRERHVFMDCAHNAVFSEQQRQLEEALHVVDSDTIADLYAKATEEPTHRAHLRAESLHTQLTSVNARLGSRRWTMDMGMGRRGRAYPPKRHAVPAPSLADNFDFSEAHPPSRPPPPMTSPRRSCGVKKIPLPSQVLQSPNQNRWKSAPGDSGDRGLSTMNSNASLGLPRRQRTPQCQERKTLGFENVLSPLTTPAL